MRLPLLLAALIAACLAVGPGPALADEAPIQPVEDDDEAARIWFYMDDGGLVTFVDSLDLIPAQYRDRAQATNLVTTVDQAPPRPATASPRARPAPVEEPPEQTPEPAPPSTQERLQQLRGERDEVIDELGALEEGWSEQTELSAEALEQRSVQLERRLSEIDAEITRLERR